MKRRTLALALLAWTLSPIVLTLDIPDASAAVSDGKIHFYQQLNTAPQTISTSGSYPIATLYSGSDPENAGLPWFSNTANIKECDAFLNGVWFSENPNQTVLPCGPGATDSANANGLADRLVAEGVIIVPAGATSVKVQMSNFDPSSSTAYHAYGYLYSSSTADLSRAAYRGGGELQYPNGSSITMDVPINQCSEAAAFRTYLMDPWAYSGMRMQWSVNGAAYTNIPSSAVSTLSGYSPTRGCDFGDLPDSAVGTGADNYQTSYDDDGARHFTTGVQLGATRTLEVDATTDDSSDDGVTITTPYLGTTGLSYTMNVSGASATSCAVGWLDSNRDGAFSASEMVMNQAVSSGTIAKTLTGLPAWASGAPYGMRVRISDEAAFCGAPKPTGFSSSGEVEDYLITPTKQPVDLSIAKTGPVSATAGSAITYEVVATNLGTETLIDPFVVADTLPTGVTGTWTCTTTSTVPCPAGLGSGNLNATVAAGVKPGDQHTFRFTGTIQAGLTASSLSNTATVTAGPNSDETKPGNNSSTAVTGVALQADLNLDKSGTSGVVDSGGAGTWTLKVTNAGPSDATSVSVVDALPVGFAAQTIATTGTGTCTLSTLTCTYPTIVANSSVTVTVTAVARPGVPHDATWSNSATVTAATHDPNTANNSDSVTGTYRRITDVVITKTRTSATPVAGRSVTYELKATNSGAGDADNVLISDPLPPGTTFQSASSGCTLNVATIECAVGALAAGASTSVSVTLNIAADFADGADLTNTATVTTSTQETNAGNNSASANDTVVRQADLSITKVADLDPAVAGSTVAYTLQVTNRGPSVATVVHVTDTLPAAFDLSSMEIPAGCTLNGDALGCDLGTLAVNESASLVVRGKLRSDVAAGTNVSNTAVVAGAETDPNENDNSSTEIVGTRRDARLTITKNPSVNPVVAGTSMVWQVVVTNEGPSIASGILVTDQLPAGMSFRSAASDPGCSANATGLVTCTRATLVVGSETTFDIAVDVAQGTEAGAVLKNSASVVSTETTQPVGATSEVTVERHVDLRVSKTGPESVTAGERATWTMEVTNNGPSTASHVEISDLLPANFTFESATGATCTGVSQIVCDLGDTAALASVTVTLTATADAAIAAGTQVVNVASVTTTDNDTDSSNDRASAPSEVDRRVALSIAKTTLVNPVSLGQPASFQVTVTNAGPSAADGVTIVDVLPAGLTFDPAASDSTCTADGQTVTCVPGVTLAPGGSYSVVITASTEPDGNSGTIRNEAAVTSAEQPTAVIDGAEVDLVRSFTLDLLKTQTVDPVVAGEAIQWTLVVVNSGPSAALNVVVDDALPVGVSATSIQTTQGTCTGGVHCELGTVEPGTVTITIDAIVDQGYVPEGQVSAPITNTAVLIADEFDSTTCTGCTSEGTVTSSADLVTTKELVDGPLVAGSPATWRVTIQNLGPSTARNVVATDQIQAPLTFSTDSDNRCAELAGIVTCSVGSLAAGLSTDLLIVTEVPADVAVGTAVSNTVDVTTVTPDPEPGCTACTAGPFPITASADLVTTKSTTATSAVAGSLVEWNVRVENRGPSTARSVTVVDPLDQLTSFVGAASSEQCTADEQQVTCALGDLAPNTVVDLVITVRVDPNAAVGAELSNTVTTGSLTPDPNGECPDCTAGPIPVKRLIDLQIKKSASSLMTAGLEEIWTISVVNAGPSAATDVVLRDALPEGVTFVSATLGGAADACTAAGADVTCPIGAVALNERVDIVLVGRLDSTLAAGTKLTNTATVSGLEEDAAGGNDSSSVDSTVERQASVTSSKQVDRSLPAAGETLDWTIRVRNSGPSIAEGVVVADSAPAGTEFTAVSPADWCTFTPTLVNCTIPQLVPTGDEVSIVVTTRIDQSLPAGTTLTNTAQVSCPGGECATTEPSVSVQTIQSADLTTVKRLISPDIAAGEELVAGGSATWSVTVHNAGPSDAAGIVVNDTLADGLTFDPNGSSPGCTNFGQEVTCSTATLAASSDVSFTIVTKLDPAIADGTEISNTVSTTSQTPDPDPACPDCTAGPFTVVARADLTTVKRLVSPDIEAGEKLVAGEPAVWEVLVHNDGPSDAVSVEVSDVLPAELAFDAAASSGSCDAVGQTVTCRAEGLPLAEDLRFTIATRVLASVPPGTEVSNTVTTTSGTTDPDPSCAGCTAGPYPVETSADLVTTKRLLSPDLAAGEKLIAGSEAVWEVVVVNNGPSDALGTEITDELADGLTFQPNGSSGECTAELQRVTCAVGTVAAGSRHTLRIATTLSSALAHGSQISNSVTTTSETPDPDPDCSSCTAGPFDVSRLVDLSVAKTGPSTFTPGGEVTWTVTVSNYGPSDASSVRIEERLPAGFALVASDPDVCVAGTPVVCTIDSLPNGDSQSLLLRTSAAASIAAGTDLTNRVRVSSNEEEAAEGNNSAEAGTEAVRSSDVSLTKAVSTATPVAGEPISWTLTVTNDGLSDATAVRIVDQLPDGILDISAEPADLCGLQGSQLSCLLTEIAAKSQATIVVHGRVDPTLAAGTDLTNTATAACDGDECPESTAEVPASSERRSDLEVLKSLVSSEVMAGQPIEWKVTVINHGPSDADSVVVTDQTSVGQSFDAADSSSECQLVGAAVQCGLSTLSSGARHEFRIVTNLDPNLTAEDSVSNSAAATSASPDPDTDNNSASAGPYSVTASADLRAEKTFASAELIAGTEVQWTVVLTNDGPSTAYAAKVTDPLPTDLSFVAASSSPGCSLSGVAVVCQGGDLAPGASATFTIATAAAAGIEASAVTNGVVTSTLTPDPEPLCLTCVAGPIEVVRQADLDAQKSLVTPTLVAGRLAVWQILVTNSGPSEARDVVVSDELAPFLTFDPSESSPGCALDAGTVRCPVGSMAPDEDRTILIGATIDPATPDGTQFTNTAALGSSSVDPTEACTGCESGPHTINRLVDLSIAKSGSSTLVPGRTTTYSLGVTNAGPSAASEVVVTDSLPEGLTPLNATGPGSACEIDGQVVTCTYASMDVGEVRNMSILADVDSALRNAESVTNTASVASAEKESDPDNNSAEVEALTESDTGLVVTKTADKAVVIAGTQVRWTVSVTNTGDSAAYSVSIADALPAGTTFVEIGAVEGGESGRCTQDQANPEIVTCDWGRVAAGATASAEIVALVSSNVADLSTLTNSATATCASCAPSTATTTVDVVRRADLVTSKRLLTAPVIAGETDTFEITVRNDGPSTANSVVVGDTLDPHLSFAAAESSEECAADGAEVTCALGTLTNGETRTVRISVAVAAATPVSYSFSNAATVTSPVIDPQPECPACTSGPHTVLTSADLVTAKRLVSAEVVAGNDAVWEITVRNDGPSDAVEVELVDGLDPQMTLLAGGSSAGCVAVVPDGATGQMVRCPIGTIAAGSTATIRIHVAVSASWDPARPMNNQVGITTPTPDPEPECPACIAGPIPVVARADLGTTKRLVSSSVVAGEPAVWEVVVVNHGPSDARAVTVSDRLALFLSFDGGGSSSGCTAAGQDVTCVVGTIPAGETRVLRVAAIVLPKTLAGTEFTNSVTITSPTPDPEPECPACVSGPHVVENSAEIRIEKSGSSTAIRGGQTSWTITVTNDGPSDAHGVSVTDTAPSGVTFTEARTGGGECEFTGTSMQCEFAVVPLGAQRTVTLSADLDPAYPSGATITNVANVTSLDDVDTWNNSDDHTMVIASDSGLVVTKTADSAAPVAGTAITWTVSVLNQGPSNAESVVLRDVLPSSVVNPQVAEEGCSMNGQELECSGFSLGVGESRDVQVTATVSPSIDPGSTIVNSATAGCADCREATGSTSVRAETRADLTATKSVDRSPVVPGTPVGWTVRVDNRGPSDARNVVVTDRIGEGWTFVSADPAEICSESDGLITCSIGTLGAKDGIDLHFVMVAPETLEHGTTVSNAVGVTTETVDPEPTCSTCVAGPVPVERSADLRAVKTLLTTPVVAGELAEWSIDVSNLGPSAASSVTISDVLDPSLTFVSAWSSPGCIGGEGGEVECFVGELSVGEHRELVISAMVSPSTAEGYQFTNTVTTGSPDPDPEPECPTCTSGPHTVTTSADLNVTKRLLSAPLTAGERAVWQLDVVNHGPSSARDVEIVDELPAGLRFVPEASDPRCAFVDDAVRCAIGTLADGGFDSVLLAMDVDSALRAGTQLTNTAEPVSPTPDPEPECPTCISGPHVVDAFADLVVDVSGPATVVAGGAIDWSVSVRNEGPATAYGSTLTIALPEGFAPAAIEEWGLPEGVTCEISGNTVSCDLGDMALGAQVTFHIPAVATSNLKAGSTWSLNAEVASATEDANLGNNTDSTPTVTTRTSGISVTKSVSNPEPLAGTGVTWTVVVANSGSSDADGVVVADQLPEGVEVPQPPVGCTVDGQLVTCAIEHLPAGETHAFDLVAAIAPNLAAGSDLTNAVTVTCPGGECAETTNSVEAVSRASADVDLVKTLEDPELVAGGRATWGLTAMNRGPSTARDVQVVDRLAEGLSVVEPLPSQCSATDEVVTCELGDLEPEQSIDLRLVTQIAAGYEGDTVTNAAEITTSTPDPEPNCENCSSGPHAVAHDVQIAVEKTASETEVAAGGELTWTIAISNEGRSAAAQVVATDRYPEGVEFLDGPSGCAAKDGQVVCTVDSLEPGARVLLPLRFKVVEGAEPLVNGVEVNGVDAESQVSVTADAVASPVSVVKAALLDLDKTVVGDPTVAKGAQLRFDLKVRNLGDATSNEVVITDELPAALRFEVKGADPLCTAVRDGIVRCELGDLPAGSSKTLRIVTTVIAETGGTFENRAVVTGTGSSADGGLALAPFEVSPTPTPDTSVRGPLALTGAQITALLMVAAILTAGGVLALLVRRKRSDPNGDEA